MDFHGSRWISRQALRLEDKVGEVLEDGAVVELVQRPNAFVLREAG